MAKNREELTIFVERYMHFRNLWTIYKDLLTGQYVPSVNSEDDPNESAYQAFTKPKTTMMLTLYAYFYSLIEDSSDAINAFRIWREHFPEKEAAIAAVETQIKPMTNDLRVYRNRLGFHGSRSIAHEERGFDFFANTTGTEAWNAMINFMSLAAALLAADKAAKDLNDTELLKYGKWIDGIMELAKQQMNS